ncbi:zf-HC2 domain-containing protein [Kribbella sp. NBC_00382]|uniref:anti-sigma factor family protein n=1 Tax=Kribbella sp. NBC_00382 TaxID=2975967 RepID=UPI002E1FAA4F
MSEHDHSQLGAYVLGGLEPDEIREVDEHLSGCAEAREELAGFEEMKEFLGEVPPEAFLDGPPEDGDLLLQRTLRQVRSEAAEAEPVGHQVAEQTAGGSRKRGPWLLVAAAVVVVAGALGGGVLIGRQSVDEPVAGATPPPAGSKQATATDAKTKVTMATTVEPRAGWAWVNVQLTNLKAGDKCEMLITDKTGRVYVAGSWVISEKAAKEGSRFGGGVLVPIDQVKSVEIKTVQGAHIVTTQV